MFGRYHSILFSLVALASTPCSRAFAPALHYLYVSPQHAACPTQAQSSLQRKMVLSPDRHEHQQSGTASPIDRRNMERHTFLLKGAGAGALVFTTTWLPSYAEEVHISSIAHVMSSNWCMQTDQNQLQGEAVEAVPSAVRACQSFCCCIDRSIV